MTHIVVVRRQLVNSHGHQWHSIIWTKQKCPSQ